MACISVTVRELEEIINVCNAKLEALVRGRYKIRIQEKQIEQNGANIQLVFKNGQKEFRKEMKICGFDTEEYLRQQIRADIQNYFQLMNYIC